MATAAGSHGILARVGTAAAESHGALARVHFVTQTKRSTSVPISDVLSRLHIDVSGTVATVRGTRTSLHSLTINGRARVFLGDGSPLWDLKFLSQSKRRPPRAATVRLMRATDWLGVLLVCTDAAEKEKAASASEGSAAAEETAVDTGGKYPCKYGASCRDKHDAKHCAKYWHPVGSATCSTSGCDRAPGGGFTTCCATCKSSGGVSHASHCFEVQPVANLVVFSIEREGEDWLLHLRGLSGKATRASSRLCRYGCGMGVWQSSDKTFDTCCKKCASGSGRAGCGHSYLCAGPAPGEELADFEDTVNLSALLPPARPLDLGRATSDGPATSDALETDHLSKLSPVATKKECGICFDDDIAGAPVLCKRGHSFCNGCMARHIAEELGSKGILPACPLSSECNHLLTRDQVEDILGSGTEEAHPSMRRFDLLAQRIGLQAIGAFPCARDGCQDWIVPSRPGQQQLVECPACRVRFCSLCKRKPYHWRIPRCDDVPRVDEEWHQWLRNGRDAYLARLAAEDAKYAQLLEELNSKKAEQARMLAEAEARKKEFAEMEDWKAKNCKCCPSCKRVINKVDGCDSMVCGRNYHGGDIQNGCGHSFNWRTAPAYTPQAADHLEKGEAAADLGPAPERQRLFWECDPGVYLRCAMCRSAIEGPLFLCVDCTACCACLRCANGLGSEAGGQHQPDSHVFSIFWKPADLPSASLQILKKYRLTTRRKFRHGEALSPEETLIDMGFSADVVRAALAAAGGDVSRAAELLLSSSAQKTGVISL